MMKANRQVRRRIQCRGTVQGVGFRPAIYRLAVSLELGGWVLNSPQGVIIEIQGSPNVLDRFVKDLPAALPILADLQDIESSIVPTEEWSPFQVRRSEGGDQARGSLPPDSAPCQECRQDMEEVSNRRRHYPFTTCSNCGPRFSVVHNLPYDRERTSMGCFPMCPDCESEYTNPADRRFHAEPLACPACGPRLWLAARGGEALGEGEEALFKAQRMLSDGGIVAVKGMGGFQLACRADRAASVETLRERKRRFGKPFAVMARDIETARQCAHLHPSDEKLLQSAAAPILLAPHRKGSPVARAAAPGCADIGIMLPTTPLHIELFRGTDYALLVMTSGNISDEPICCGNREALKRLAGIADLFLLHDRDVVRRLDDSVMRTDDGIHYSVRRSRGSVPQSLPLPETSPQPALALGGHLQTTACLAIEDAAVPSQHVGDLDHEEAREFLLEAAMGLEELTQTRASAVAVDLHPDYSSTWLGAALSKERGIPLLRFQHHLAHAAAVLGEHQMFPQRGERCAAVILDGTGWGPDGTAWGGEWLILDGALKWRRCAHLESMSLVGG
ncbi:MAG: carbamoyltransferase HypF, partial [Candidatus Eisenbacteria bacterium]|nr:carbamoyltransferase HypF [Candidatus Eisenbacteria bacterium]